MAVDFPFLANWRVPPKVEFDVPSDIHTSIMLKEQRVTALAQGDSVRRYTVMYSDVEEYGRIHEALISGSQDDGTFWIPFPLEPIEISFDFSDSAFPNWWSGTVVAVGGPTWWQTNSVFVPEGVSGELPLPPAPGITFTRTEKIIRINRLDPTNYEIKTLLKWQAFPTASTLSYQIDSNWSAFGVMHTELFFLMDLVRLVSVVKKSWTDDKHDYTITWESIR